MFLMTSLQLRFLLASIHHQPFHLPTSPDQPNQLNQLNQLSQPNQLNELYQPYQVIQPLQLYQPHQEVTLKSIGISKGSQKVKFSRTLILPDSGLEEKAREPRRVEKEETPWKKRAPGHVLLYIPPSVAKHAVNKGFSGKKPKLTNLLGPLFRLC